MNKKNRIKKYFIIVSATLIGGLIFAYSARLIHFYLLENKKDDEWFKGQKEFAENLCSIIDRDYWGRFLDFNIIDKWRESDKPTSQEDILHYQNILALLSKCCQFQNTVKKVKNL